MAIPTSFQVLRGVTPDSKENKYEGRVSSLGITAARVSYKENEDMAKTGGGEEGGVERVTRVVGREKRERERERTRRKRAGRGREERVEGRKTLGGHSSI